MDRFFNPSGFAVVGASNNPSKPQYYLAANLRDLGYKGRVFLINPRMKEAFGQPVYPDIAALPEPVDLAMLVIQPTLVPDCVDQCGRKGIRNVIIGSGGFSETGEDGRRLMEKTLETARRFGVRIMGPNSIGVTNTEAGFSTAFIDAPLPNPGPVSLITQTGLVGGPLLHWLSAVSKTACLGNRADLDADEVLAYLADDRLTGVVGVHSEGFNDPAKFITAARRTFEVGKPVVLLKAGRSEQGADIAAGHTASMSSDDRMLLVAARQAGVIPADGMNDFFDTLKVMASFRPDERPFGVGVVSLSGAGLVLAGDACASLGLEIAPAEGVGTCVPGRALYDVGSWSGELKIGNIFYDTARLALSQRGVTHCVVLMAPTPHLFNFDPADVFGRLGREFPDKAILAVILGHRRMSAEWGDALEAVGIPVLSSMETALGGIARHQAWCRRKAG